MAGNVVVKLLRFKSPTSKDARGSNAAHLEYIGGRPGTDKSISSDSLSLNSTVANLNAISPDEKYIAYIGTRPGVDKKGVHGEHLSDHGLFGQYGVPDMQAVANEVKNLKNSPMYRMVISLDETTASDLGFDNKAKWETLIRSQTVDLAEKMSIPAQDMGWVAALHLKDGHPHVHLVVWDMKDRTRRNRGLNFIPKDNLNGIREGFTKAIYAEKRQELYAIKNASRDMIIEMAKSDTAQVREFLHRSTARNETITMPAPSSSSIKQLSSSITELSEIMPDHGRINYAFMPNDVKAKVDSIVKQVLSNPIYAAKLGDVTKAVQSLTEQFTLNLDKITSTTDKAAADIGKRVAQQVLRAAADIKQDSTKAAIHDSIGTLLTIKKPLFIGSADSLKLFHCFAAAGVDRQAALTICRNIIPKQVYDEISKAKGQQIDTAEKLVDSAYDTLAEKVNIFDWKRITAKIETAENRVMANEEKAVHLAAANTAVGLFRSIFNIMQSPKSKNPLHNFFAKERAPHRHRDSLYTEDELE